MKTSLVAKILIGFALGTGIGLFLAEFCDSSVTNRILPYIMPFGNVLVAMVTNPTLQIHGAQAMAEGQSEGVKAMDSLKVNRALSSFSLPLGATVNM